MSEDPMLTHVIVVTANYWGRGHTIDEAFEACRESGGEIQLAKYGYWAWRVTKDSRVHGVDGSIEYPDGHPPKLLESAWVKDRGAP